MVRATVGAIASLLALLVTLGAAGPAFAQTRLVITEFHYDDDGRYEDQVADELLFQGDYDVVPYERFRDEVNDLGLDLEGFLAEPSRVRDVAEFLGFDALVYGSLDRRRRPRSLTLTVYDGATGEATGSTDIAVSVSGDLENDAFDRGIRRVGELIDRTRGGGRTGVGGRDGSRVSFLPADEPREESDGGWLRMQAGLDVVQRTFTISSADAGIQYDSGFYPGLEGSVEVYPVRAFSPGTLDGLGLKVRIARYFVDTTLVLEDFSLDVPTRHKEFGINLLYRHTLGPIELVGSVGWEHLAFTLGDNAVYQSSEYSGIALAVGGWYQALANLLRVGINVEIRPAPSLGNAETDAFGDGSAFGFAFGAGVEVTPLPHFSILGFYRFRQYANTYDGTGTSDLTGSLDATDRFHALGLRLGYAY